MAVIGAGVAGLAAAARLAVAGHPVTVFEASGSFGGKMHQFDLPGGYRFDAGPSLFTLPQLVDDVFRLAHREPADYFRYERLDPITSYFFADGTRLTAWADAAKFAAEVEQKLDVPAAAVTRFLAAQRAGLRRHGGHVFAQVLAQGRHVSQRRNAEGGGRPTLLGSHGHHARPPRTSLWAGRATGAALRPLRYLQRLRPVPGPGHALAHSAFGARHWGVLIPRAVFMPLPAACTGWPAEFGVKFRYNEPVQEILTAGDVVYRRAH
ncbi:MAG: FAD-dependent oxidoreductase [Hymenobacter sp.]